MAFRPLLFAVCTTISQCRWGQVEMLTMSGWTSFSIFL